MHGSVLGFFAYGALQAKEVTGKDVLEVGSLDVNGSVRPFVQARHPASYVGVDIVDGPGVDRVVDAVDLVETFGVDAFDVVVCCEMLEHAEDWRAAVANMVAVLRPGGVLVVTTRSPGFAYHHPPDRWRFTQESFAEIIKRLGFERLVLMDDPEYPGVFCKARKPRGWNIPEHYRSLHGVTGVTPVAEPLTWLGLPCNPDGTGYYRFWSPWAELARSSGHHALIPPPGQHQFTPDDDQVEQLDLLAQQRPGDPGTVRRWRRWKGRTPLVFETDDHLLAPDRSGLPHWLDSEMRDGVLACLELADLVTVSTEPLAEAMAAHTSAPVRVIGNHIHEDLLGMERPRRDRVTLCWAGGFTHLQDLALIQEPLRRLLTASMKVRKKDRDYEVLEYDPPNSFDLHFLGTDYSPLVGADCRFTPWQPNVWDYYAAIDGDIGLIPLADTPFNRCRSPIKALEYAALGIPVVASDIDPYRGFVVDGVTGWLARTEQDWSRRIRDLVHDPAMREEMGVKAREVAQQHTIQQGYRLWQNAYEEACSG